MIRTAEDLMQELLALDESHGIEAKRCTQVDRSVMETVCAFANEPGLGGGYLLLGVERDPQDLFSNAYQAVGIANPDKLQSDLASQCASVFNRPVRPRIAVETLGDKTVVVVFVPEAAPADKPIYLSNLGLPRGAFRRVGPTDQEGTEDDLIALYAGHQVDTYDAVVLEDASLEDIDPLAIEDYRKLRGQINPSAEELTWTDPDLLRALGCVKNQNTRAGIRLLPTVAGILLFGTALALRRCFPMVRIDYIRVAGRTWVEDPNHRFDTLEIRAPLFTAIRRATNTVRDELLQSGTVPEGSLVREDAPTLPLRVIREAIVNAVMHRSYRIHGAIQIIRYANRLEIRNPHIAAVLHEVSMAETKGSGIRAMRELMLGRDLLPPTLESSRRPDQFVATFLFHHFLGPDDLVWLRRLTTETISDEEARALVFVREVGAIDNSSYRAINRTDTLNASAHLRRLRDLGLVDMKGSGSRTYYVPGDVMLMPADGHQSTADGHQLSSDGHQSPPLPDGLKARIAATGMRPRKEILRSLIVDVCQWQPSSSREIAFILGKQDHKKILRNHLSPMVAEGVLAYTIPAMENHPEQRYTLPDATLQNE